MPSKEKKRELYIAGSLAELQKKSEVKTPTTNARILVKSADTMFREAEKFDVQGDEERAFIMYMRYFNLVKQVKASQDYKKNKQYYDNLIGQKNQVRAIEQAEELAASLKERYDFKEAEAVAQKFAALEASGQRKEKEEREEEERERQENSNRRKKNSSLDENGTKDQPSTSASNEASKPSITPTSLCSLLRDSNTQLIIMDARPSADFSESHINHACCVSVPQEALTPGTTVTSMESHLPSDSLSLWKRRGAVDHIVLVDWSSLLDDLAIGTPLRTLKDALFVYDSTVIIKSEPLVLEGGYSQWLLYYPTMTTNSRVTRPSQSNVASTVALLDFDYPEFDEPEPPKPDLPIPPSTTSSPPEPTTPTTPPNNVKAAIPQFNRALKPKSSGHSIAEAVAKSGELNNARNANLMMTMTRDANLAGGGGQGGGGVSVLSNQLYPSFVVAATPSNKKGGEKNTNVVAEEERTGIKKAGDDNAPPPPPPSPPAPVSAATMESQEEAEARARLRSLEEKRKKEEKALADIMRKKRHMEQDIKEMQTLSAQETTMREAHEKTVKEEEAERQRQKEVERLRLERKKRELETEREKEQKDILAKEKELEDARERAEREKKEEAEEAERKEGAAAAQRRAALQQAEKTRQEITEKERQELERRQKDEQARTAEEERMKKEEEERRRKKEEEEERARKEKEEEEERGRRREKAAAEERERRRKEEEEEEEKKRGRESQEGAIRQAQEPKMIPSPSLPPGWEKRLDNSTRRYYYIDHIHSKTQWEPPQMSTAQKKDTYKAKLKEEPSTSTRGGLSRSHSSPDIMKQLADEARLANKPVYDRTSKPSVSSLVPETNSLKQPVTRIVARKRDLNPVYGNVGPAMTGLRNLGNTCYMNSTVQCLNNATPLVTYLLNDYYLNDINRDSSQGMHGEVVDEFAVVVKALWSGQYRSITPRDLKSTVGEYNPMFAGYQQQDSQEFLTFLLDGLHEGLNEVKKRPQIPDQENDGLPDHKAAHLAWENHKRLHRSIIVELFQGQLKSTLKCRTCYKTSVTFQASMYISLPIPASNRCSLKDCLRSFLQPEMMTGSCKWKCPQCKMERDAEKKIDIWKLPHILLIGLNRFVSDGMWMQKKTTYVDFPINDLDLEQFTLGPKNRSRYNLFGVSNHYGTMEGGHYTAFCRNPCKSRWHRFDDQEVTEMSQSDVKTSAAFVLYYSAIPLNTPQFKRKL